MKNYYIFTEIVGCGKIGKIALDSFHKYHNLPIHIYGTKEDFSHITYNENNIFIEIDQKILNKFNLGHWGTAFLWENIIKTCTEDTLIHFDSDVIFRDQIVDTLISKSKEGFDLIGPRRNYHNNKCNRNDVRFITDLCQTDLILFNKKMISQKFLSKYPFTDYFKELTNISMRQIAKSISSKIKQLKSQNFFISKLSKMIHGTYTPFNFPHIDFFDPVMLDMINNGAKIFYLDPNETGTDDFYGQHHTQVKELDFGTKIVHFSGVGSGLNFLNKDKQIREVSETYKIHCINRYKLFCRIFYSEYINEAELEHNYADMLAIKNWY